MDCARADLGRILHESAINPCHCLNGADYFRADQQGLTPTGETALHRFLAFHTTSREALADFLNAAAASNRVDVAALLHHRNRAGATALHVALHRNSWHVAGIVDLLLQVAPQLAVTPMHCGTYPLHVLTGQSLTINSTVFAVLLQAAPSVATEQDVHGDTPLSLLYKNVLRFRWARAWELQGQPPQGFDTGSSSSSRLQKKDLSCMTIIAPDQFLECSLQLLEASAQHSHNNNSNHNHPRNKCCSWLTWHSICATDRCPPLLIRMLLHQILFQQQQEQGDTPACAASSVRRPFRERDARGRLPLHWAATAQAVSTRFLPSDCAPQHRTVLELVLTAFPAAASVPDGAGRLPLNVAVSNPTLLGIAGENNNSKSVAVRSPVKAVMALARTFPASLAVPDPETGLYPVLQLAATGSDIMSVDGDDDDADADNEDGVMDVLYRLLHTNPSVCNYHRQSI